MGKWTNGQMGDFLARDLLKEAGLLLCAGLCLERDAMLRPATLPASPPLNPLDTAVPLRSRRPSIM
jgi:hypothetical protein